MLTTYTFSLIFAAAEEEKGGTLLSTVVNLLLMAAIGGAMYFLLIRPQRRRMKESQELQRSIEVEDYVITNSGLCGYIKRMTNDFIWLEIDDSVEVRFSRSAILRKIDPQLEEEEKEEGE